MDTERTYERSLPSSGWGVWPAMPWSAIAAGALAGFGVTLIMAALGAALGVTAGAAMADNLSVDRGEILGIGVGVVLWGFLSAIAAGLVGGWVYATTCPRGRTDRPALGGALTWALGVALALGIGAMGAGGLLGAAGGGAAGLASRAPELRERMSALDRTENGARPLTPEEEARLRQAAEDGAKAAAAASWILLGSLLTSLAATMLSAGLFMKKEEARKPDTRIRPHPAVTS